MKDSIEARAVKIAARVMQAAGLCRYDTPTKCHRLYFDETTCDKCIESWLLSKARAELRSSERHPEMRLAGERSANHRTRDEKGEA